MSSRVFLAKQRETFRQRVLGRRKKKPYLGPHIKHLTFCRAQRRVRSDLGPLSFFLHQFWYRHVRKYYRTTKRKDKLIHTTT